MARRNGSRGFDIVGVLTNIPVVITFVLALAAWWTAFIGQIITEHKYDELSNSAGSSVGVAWFGIFLQGIVIGFLFYALAAGLLEIYRFQLTAFLCVALVFAVLGTNQGIYSSLSYQTAIGAGWILLAIVDILWLLFITADDETRLSLVFSSYATDPSSGGGSGGSGLPHSHSGRIRSMRQSRRASSALGMSAASPSAIDLHSGGSHLNHGTPSSMGMNMGMGNNTHYAAGGQGYGMGGLGSAPGSIKGQNSMHSLNTHPSMTNAQAGGNGNVPGSAGSGRATPVNGAAGASGSGSAGGAGTSTDKQLKAKALYAYSASPDDPNEIGFVKGEILDILDNSGKWFSARKQDGTQGIVPSNYLQML